MLGSSVTFKAGLFLQLKQNVVTLDTNSLEQSPSWEANRSLASQ